MNYYHYTYSHSGARLNKILLVRQKCRTITSKVVFLIFTLFVSQIFAKDISFFIPEDHELYSTLDSLHKIMNKSEIEFSQFETKVIRESNVRNDKIIVKGQYLNFALENRLTDTASVLKYCTLMNKSLSTKENYFSILLSALKGDERVMCFNFLKQIKNSISEASVLDREFREKTYVQEKPEIGNNNVSLKIEDNTNEILDEILKEDEDFTYSHEMKFEKRDSIEDTTSIKMIGQTQNTDMLLKIDTINENESMINSMAGFFEGQTKKTNITDDSENPKVN